MLKPLILSYLDRSSSLAEVFGHQSQHSQKKKKNNFYSLYLRKQASSNVSVNQIAEYFT